MPVNIKMLLQNYFTNRKKIRVSLEQFSLIVNGFSEIALQDREMAELLLSEENRIVQEISKNNDNYFLRFKAAHPDLFEQLLAMSLLPVRRAEALRRQALPGRLDLADGGRTFLAVQRNRWLQRGSDEQMSLSLNGIEYPMITRYTRNFNVPLCSVGSSSSREIIVLDPSSPLLQMYYSMLIKSAAEKCHSTKEVLQLVLRSTRRVFPSAEDDKLPKKPKEEPVVMLLDDFMKAGAGVCRHHTLLNAYVLSRLVADGIFQGEVIHHRQDITGGAHTWNVFKDKKDGKWYSLDSLWEELICLNDEPGKVNEVYNDSHMEDFLMRRYRESSSPVAAEIVVPPLASPARPVAAAARDTTPPVLPPVVVAAGSIVPPSPSPGPEAAKVAVPPVSSSVIEAHQQCLVQIKSILDNYKSSAPPCKSQTAKDAVDALNRGLSKRFVTLKQAVGTENFPHVLQTFKGKCVKYVGIAASSLNKELGWKTHLANLLIRIGNVVIRAVTLNRKGRFFELTTESESGKSVKKLGSDIANIGAEGQTKPPGSKI